MNAVEIEEAVSSLASADFDAKEFPFAFLAAFGNKETTIKRLRSGSSNASDVQGGVLQRYPWMLPQDQLCHEKNETNPNTLAELADIRKVKQKQKVQPRQELCQTKSL